MRRVLCLVLSSILSFSPLSPAWAQASGSESKEAKLKKLVELLSSFSDEDYEAALSRMPEGAAQSPALASRGTVMKSAYTTLAGYEYQKASRQASEGNKGRYEEAYNRVGGPQALQEVGWQVDVLKWVGNAALNYWLKGGQDFMGGGGAAPGAMASSSAEAFTDTGAAIEAEATAEGHFDKGQEYERLASAAVKADTEAERLASRRERLKKVIELLKSVSDEDYLQAKGQAAKEETRAPQLASRAKALQSAYAALAVLEYEGAAKEVPGGLGHAEARQKAVEESAKALGVSPEALQEAGWQVDLLKWLGNAALNYWLYGGKDLVGGERGADPRTAQAERTLAGLELKLADPAAGPEKRAELRHQMGAAYEELAADAVEPESESELAARKKERLRLLAELLASVSEDEYKEALNMVPGEGAKTQLSSRGEVLKSAYTTLAALEYRDAERQAPVEAALQYSANLERVSREGDLVVEPKTLKEKGWGKKLLGLAALGGVGYAVYRFHEQNHRKRGRHSAHNPHHTPGCPPGKVAGPSGCEEEKPVGPVDKSCPPGQARRPEGHCAMEFWWDVPNMLIGRSNHAATLLKDGRVLVTGGYYGGLKAEIYDFRTRAWSPTGERSGHQYVTTTLLPDGQVLALGWDGSGTREFYDPVTGKWRKADPLPVEMAYGGHTVLPLANRTFLIFHYAHREGHRATFAIHYDPARENWENLGSGPKDGLLCHDAALLPDGRIMFYSVRPPFERGARQGGKTSTEIYDPVRRTWSPGSAPPEMNGCPGVVNLPNGKALVTALRVGYDEQPHAASEVFDSADGKWSPTHPAILCRTGEQGACRSMLIPDGRILVLNSGVKLKLYDPRTGKVTHHEGGMSDTSRGSVLLGDGRLFVSGIANWSARIFDPSVRPTGPVEAGLGMDLLETLLMLAGELASSELTPEGRAEIHGKRAAVYEQLASAALPSKAAPGKPAAVPPVAPRVQEKVPEPELTPEEEVRRRAEKSMGDLDKEGRRKSKR